MSFTKKNIQLVDKNISGVYEIRNILNNKTYYGSSYHIRVRLLEHRSYLLSNKHHNKKLQNAYNKYGEHNFEFRIVETCEPIRNTLLNIEQKYLDLNPWYNINKYADGGDIGIRKTENSTYRNGAIQGFDPVTYDIKFTFKNISEANLYFNKYEFNPCIIRSIQSFGKYSAYGLLWKFTNRDVESFKNKYTHVKKKIAKYSLDGELLEIFDSVSQASKSIGIKKNFFRNINNRNGRFKEFVWKYLDKYDK